MSNISGFELEMNEIFVQIRSKNVRETVSYSLDHCTVREPNKKNAFA